MTDSEVISRIDAALAEEFELDLGVMTPDASLRDDLELDSLDYVDMVVVLQNELGVKIRDESAVREISTLGDIHRFCLNKLRESGG